jgi:transcriptional regulator with XRE-family HTH domain/sRNA-binding regulator protein Hfq
MPSNSLRPIRERKGLTIAQLAGKTSISIRTLQSYEAGERAISPDDLRKLSRVLYASPAEILQAWEPPRSPPSSRPAAESRAPTPPSAALPAREAGSRRPAGARPGPPRSAVARPARSPREPAPPRPPGPATAGQLEQIRNLGRRLGLDEADLVDRLGSPLESLDRAAARAVITSLRKEMEESGRWQPRIAEGPDQEGAYLARLRDHQVPIAVQLINGERYQGQIVDFTPYVIRIRDEQTGAEISLRKLAIAYYLTRGPVDDAR